MALAEQAEIESDCKVLFAERAGPLKSCSQCGTEKPLTAFTKHAASQGGYRRQCTQCRSADNKRRIAGYPAERREAIRQAKAQRDKVRSTRWPQLQKKYGISQAGYDSLFVSQNGRCALCGTQPSKRGFVVDHCHETGRVRGLLCNRCNITIGYLGDTLAAAERLVVYLTDPQYRDSQ